MKRKSDWEQSTAIRPKAGLCRHCESHSSVASLIAPEQWCVCSVLYTFSCNIFHMLLSSGFKSGEFGGHSLGGINSGISSCSNSTVVCVQWAFQDSQSSVETLFRWGEKHLSQFEANLFRKRCNVFHQNRPSFVGFITKNVLVSYFLDTCIGCNTRYLSLT